jgi:hypothetical protein
LTNFFFLNVVSNSLIINGIRTHNVSGDNDYTTIKNIAAKTWKSPRLVCVETSIDASQSHLFLYADICEYVAAVNIRNTAHLTLNNIQSIDADIWTFFVFQSDVGAVVIVW